MIEVQNLCKSFRVHKKTPGLWGSLRSVFAREYIEKHALKDVSFKIEPGEIVGLIGANGAGKTTLVKALAGIIHPTSGEARVLGFRPWEGHYDFRRNIALIMGQKAQLWWDLPAEDCFELLREIYEIPEQRFRESLKELVDALGVRDQLNIQIRRLSLGERMKMELIAALLHQPRVVYLDEPTIGLDLTAQRAIRKFVLDYRRKHQPAMILTSHYMEDIESLCERIIIVRQGEFVFDGVLSKVLNDYARHKVVSARLDLTEGRDESLPELPFEKSVAEILPAESGQMKIRVLRASVPDVAQWLLKNRKVADLSIEEDDIGTVIEALQNRKTP